MHTDKCENADSQLAKYIPTFFAFLERIFEVLNFLAERFPSVRTSNESVAFPHNRKLRYLEFWTNLIVF